MAGGALWLIVWQMKFRLSFADIQLLALTANSLPQTSEAGSVPSDDFELVGCVACHAPWTLGRCRRARGLPSGASTRDAASWPRQGSRILVARASRSPRRASRPWIFEKHFRGETPLRLMGGTPMPQEAENAMALPASRRALCRLPASHRISASSGGLGSTGPFPGGEDGSDDADSGVAHAAGRGLFVSGQL